MVGEEKADFWSSFYTAFSQTAADHALLNHWMFDAKQPDSFIFQSLKKMVPSASSQGKSRGSPSVEKSGGWIKRLNESAAGVSGVPHPSLIQGHLPLTVWPATLNITLDYLKRVLQMWCHLNWKNIYIPRARGAFEETLSLKGTERHRGLNAWSTNGIKMTPSDNVRGAFVTLTHKPLKDGWHQNQRRLPALNKADLPNREPAAVDDSEVSRAAMSGRDWWPGSAVSNSQQGASCNTSGPDPEACSVIFFSFPTNNERHGFCSCVVCFIARLRSFHCFTPHRACNWHGVPWSGDVNGRLVLSAPFFFLPKFAL